ncbi:MAG: choice-of-anchor V domain-containing protein [Bacteroidota bacterium]
MKRRNYLILTIMLGILTTGAVMKINLAPTKRSSAPGEQTCGGCHAGNINTGSGTVNLTMPTEYLPGTSYTFTYDLSDAGFTNPRYGFTTTSLDAGGNQAGSFTLLNTTTTSLQTDLVSGQMRQYMGHRVANATNTWDYQWTAPSSPQGNISFYVVGVYANRNNGISGDRVYIDTFSLPLAASYPQPSFSPSLSSSCLGDSIVFSNTTTGTITTYAWDFGSGAIPASSTQAIPPAVTYTTAGTKTIELTVTGPDGTESTSQNLVVNANPSVGILLNLVKFCEGSGGVQLQADASGGTPSYSFSWQCSNPTICGIVDDQVEDPLVNPAILPLQDTVSYSVTMVDANGCHAGTDSVDVVMVPAPRVDAGSDMTRCPLGEPVQLQASVIPDSTVPGPFTYQWMPTTGLTDPSSLSPMAMPDTTTTYRLQATDQNGCRSSDLDPLGQITVFVEPLSMADAGQDMIVCAGQPVQLLGSASGGTMGTSYSFSWSGDLSISDSTSASPTVMPQGSTTYYLEVSDDSSGCVGTTDSVVVLISELPVVDAGEDISLCEGDSIVLTASVSGADPTYDLQWTGPGFISEGTILTPQITSDTSGTLSLTASSTAGCGSSSDDLELTIEAAPLPVISGGDTLVSTSAMMYQWYFTDSLGANAAAIPGATSQVLPVRDSLLTSITNTGFMVVEVIYDNGCIKLSEPFEVPILIGIEEDFGQEILVYPIPSHDQLFIQLSQNFDQDYALTLLDMQGKIVSRQALSARQIHTFFDLSPLPSGMYLLKLSVGHSTSYRKVIRE